MCVNEARRVCLLILWLISSTQLPQDGEGDTEVLLWFHWRSRQNLFSLYCIILSFPQLKKSRSFGKLRLRSLFGDRGKLRWLGSNSFSVLSVCTRTPRLRVLFVPRAAFDLLALILTCFQVKIITLQLCLSVIVTACYMFIEAVSAWSLFDIYKDNIFAFFHWHYV